MDAELEGIDWDNPCFSLQELVDTFELPKIVCVRDGFLDTEEMTTLSSDQIMTLHYVKPCQMLKGFSEKSPSKEALCIPLNTQGKLEILPTTLPTLFKSLKAVKRDRKVTKVVSLQSHACLGLKENDILSVEGSTKKTKGKEYLNCLVLNRGGINIEIPTTYEACFHSYEEPRKINIRDIAMYSRFPCVVRIHASAPTKANYDPEDTSEFLNLESFGRIKLEGIYDYDKVVTSIRYKDKVRILQVPLNLEITVSTGKEASNEGSKYCQLCVKVHNITQLQQMDGANCEYVKMGEDRVDNIYEYIDVYAKPLVPPKKDKNTDHDKPEVPKRIISKQAQKEIYTKPKSPTLCSSLSPFSDLQENVAAEVGASNVLKADFPAKPNLASNSPDHEETTNGASVKPKQTQYVEPAVQNKNPNIQTTKVINDASRPSNIKEQGCFTIPKNLSLLDVEGVAKCLTYLHMEQYVERFQDELVDGQLLVDLNEEMMAESLGITVALHRRKLKKFIDGWRPK